MIRIIALEPPAMMPAMTSPRRSRRVVIVAPMVPYDAPPHAGGQYLQHVVRAATRIGPTTVVVPNTPVNRETSTSPGAPADLLVVGAVPASTTFGKAVNRVRTVGDAWLRRLDPGRPSTVLARGLARKGPARTALERADVVDLQWSESVRLAGLVRRINPRARVVGTYHDVQSQLFSREPATTVRGRAFWRLAARQSRRHERRDTARLDEVAVFSRKDGHLLGDPAHLRVILPPLATRHERLPDPPIGPPTVLFVAHFARPENDDAARWLLATAWQSIRESVSGVRLRLVGRGMSDELRSQVDSLPEVEAPGFVDDLAREYAEASLVVVPLRRGAGVKFKTVEALLHGVPVVTTTVGAEGIDGPDLYAAVTDDSRAFSGAAVEVLTDPGPARKRAGAAQAWAVREYSLAAFEENLGHHYGID
jgi:glycosyltransferase involved in cell wall biosynthesis